MTTAEDPEKLLDTVVIEMQEDLIKMRQAAAQVGHRTYFVFALVWRGECMHGLADMDVLTIPHLAMSFPGDGVSEAA